MKEISKMEKDMVKENNMIRMVIQNMTEILKMEKDMVKEKKMIRMVN